jgi:putative membrane protein
VAEPTDSRRPELPLVAVIAAVFVWSAIAPHDRFTWFLEVLPVLAAVPLLVLTWRRFPLTPLAYALIAAHATILMVGGHYTYAQVPLFNWLRDALGLTRNHFDRLGHFAQGFVPAIVAREVLLLRTPLRQGGWLFTIVTAICLAVSALYEIFEWGVAAATGTAADAFLGTQGDFWDTQKDMLLCLLGAVAALLTLSGAHDRAVARLAGERLPAPERAKSAAGGIYI